VRDGEKHPGNEMIRFREKEREREESRERHDEI
jgi:hypothetical protein